MPCFKSTLSLLQFFHSLALNCSSCGPTGSCVKVIMLEAVLESQHQFSIWNNTFSHYTQHPAVGDRLCRTRQRPGPQATNKTKETNICKHTSTSRHGYTYIHRSTPAEYKTTCQSCAQIEMASSVSEKPQFFIKPYHVTLLSIHLSIHPSIHPSLATPLHPLHGWQSTIPADIGCKVRYSMDRLLVIQGAHILTQTSIHTHIHTYWHF